MKRLLIVLLAFALVAGLFTVAAAEDKLSLSGSMRVRAWDLENYSDYDDNGAADELANWDQRLRIGGALKANDAVSAHFRLDFAEDSWGSDNWGGSRYNDSELQVDRAYMQIVQDLYTLKAGQLYQGAGQLIVYDNNTTGITATIKTPVIIDLHYAKLSENGSNRDERFTASEVADYDDHTTHPPDLAANEVDVDYDAEDLDAYVLQGTFKADTFSVGAFFAAIEDSTDADLSASAFGLFGTVALGPINLLAEIDVFDGDASPTQEYMGEQLYLNAEWKMDALIIGGDIYYAAGADTNGSEVQLPSLGRFYGGDWNDFQPATYGAFMADYQPTPGKIHDFTGDSAGVVGLSLYAKYMFMEKFTVWGQLAYLEPEEDNNTQYDDMTVVNLSASWDFVDNASLAVLYSTTLVTTSSAGLIPAPKDDAATRLGARMQIKF